MYASYERGNHKDHLGIKGFDKLLIMNTPSKVYWKIALGALMMFGSVPEIIRLSSYKFNGEIGVMITTSVCIAVGGAYLLYTGLYPTNKS